MPRISKRWTALAMLLLAGATLLVLASAALGYPGLNSSIEKQEIAGLTQRTIYGTCEVFMYQLPKSVSHVGYIHAELKYKPGDYDCYIYLIDSAGNICDFTEPQGYLGTFAGKEMVDFFVPDIANPDVDEYGTDIVGDTYYIMVQAFDDVSNFQISGYYPRADISGGELDVAGAYNWYRSTFRFPKSSNDWQKIHGAPYGVPFDFTPTSQGSGWMQLRYPWNPNTQQPKPSYSDPLKQYANFDQYLYPNDWSENGAIWDYDWSGTSHWRQTSRHGALPPVSLDAKLSRGLSYQFQVAKGSFKPPHDMLHYIPVLWMVSSDATQGKSAPPATGLSTVGYRADLFYPQNNYLKKWPSSVKKGATITLKGTLAIVPAWAGQTGTVLAWAPAGTSVKIERMYDGGSWKQVASTKVEGTAGKWTANVKSTKTARFRAVWKGSVMESISVSAQKTPAGGKAEAAFTRYLMAKDDQVFLDGTVDLVVTAIDATAGVTLNTTWDTATYTTGGAAFAGATLKAGSAPLEITMSDGTKVKVSYKATNYYREKSLKKKINVK